MCADPLHNPTSGNRGSANDSSVKLSSSQATQEEGGGEGQGREEPNCEGMRGKERGRGAGVRGAEMQWEGEGEGALVNDLCIA